MQNIFVKKIWIYPVLLAVVVFACLLVSAKLLHRPDATELILKNDKIQLHTLADGDPKKIGHKNWVLANLYVADESFLRPQTSPSQDPRTAVEISQEDTNGLANVAKVILVASENPNLEVEDVLAWTVLIEKLRRSGLSKFATNVLPVNKELMDAFQTARNQYMTGSAQDSTERGAELYFLGSQVQYVFNQIATDDSYSDEIKKELMQDMVYLTFVNSNNNLSAGYVNYRRQALKLFYADVASGQDVVRIIPEYNLIGAVAYMTAAYSVKRVWNIDTAYLWESNKIAGKDFPTETFISFKQLQQAHANAVTYLELVDQQTGHSNELWSYNAFGVRLSLALASVIAAEKNIPEITPSAAAEVINNAMVPIVSLYKSEPQSRFFEYMKQIKTTPYAASLRALAVKDNLESAPIFMTAGW